MTRFQYSATHDSRRFYICAISPQLHCTSFLHIITKSWLCCFLLNLFLLLPPTPLLPPTVSHLLLLLGPTQRSLVLITLNKLRYLKQPTSSNIQFHIVLLCICRQSAIHKRALLLNSATFVTYIYVLIRVYLLRQNTHREVTPHISYCRVAGETQSENKEQRLKASLADGVKK